MQIRNNVIYILFFGLIILAVLLSYRNILNVYYLHDEWRQLAGVQIEGYKFVINLYSPLEILFGKGRIFGTLINNLIYIYFPYNIIPFIFLFLIFHILNCLLILKLFLDITNDKRIAIIGALFFATTSRHEQALSWLGAGTEIILSTFFAFLAFNQLLKYCRKSKLIHLFATILLLYIGFLFKENTIYYLLLFPSIYYLLTNKKVDFINIIRKNWLMIVTIILFFFVIICKFSGLYINTFSNNSLIKYIFNLIYYPFISFGQYLIPFRLTKKIAEWLLYFNYNVFNHTPNNDLIINFVLSDMVSSVISVLGIALVGYIYFIKPKKRKLIIISVLWYIMSFIPTSFRLVYRYDSYIDSRYLYQSTPAISLLFGILIINLFEHFYKKSFNRIIKISFIILISIFFFKQISITNREVKLIGIYGTDMNNFVNKYQKLNYNIPSCPIFYVESNRNYFQQNNKLPFMLGGGYILSVMNYQSHKIDAYFLEKRYLEAFDAQGFRKNNNSCYGYYWNKQDLVSLFESDKSLQTIQIIAFYWDSNKQNITDISKEIREYINKQLNKNVDHNIYNY
jgi:hypothetical protein